jgi:glycosyltransferase involved in cell wall biosynthesis
MRKKTILVHSNFCRALTGFGKNKKNILKYLYQTGKYKIVEAANGRLEGDPSLDNLPWDCYGTLKNRSSIKEEEKQINGYGSLLIDKIINEVRPDVYIGVEDIWGFKNIHHKPWFNKVNTMIWTTLDSLPILPEAVEFAPKIDNYYVWSNFAENAFKKIGYDHIKTLRGSLETKNFFKLSEQERLDLRKDNNISENDFIVGFVFRNQLRKSVPNLLDGFKKFKQKNANSKLLLHTCWSEGWDIPRLLEEKEMHRSDILTTYFCDSCGVYKVKAFSSDKDVCPECGSGGFHTTNVVKGVTEKQLNEVYNLMDVYCHPFTSGGQEIPVQEAKLTELVTLVTDYSCGEDSCSEESGGLPLSWHEYREPGTQFIKASTDPDSINQMLQSVYDMSVEEKVELGKKSRQWVIDNFSVEVIGKQLESLIDKMPLLDEKENIEDPSYNEDFDFPEGMNNEDFVVCIYKNILNDRVDKNSPGYKKWVSDLNSLVSSQKEIYRHFISVAKDQNKSKKIKFEDVLSDSDKGKRVAVVIKGDDVDVLLINSLMKNLQEKHKRHNIYVFLDSKFFAYIEDNPYVYKCVPYSESISNPLVLEGSGAHEGFFEAAYYPTATTRLLPCNIHNGI